MSFPYLQLPYDVQLDILNQVDIGSLDCLRLSCREICEFIADNRRRIKVGRTVRLADLLGITKAPTREYSNLTIVGQEKTTNFKQQWNHDIFYNMKIGKLFLSNVTHPATVEKFHNHIIKYGITADWFCARGSQVTTTMLSVLNPKRLSIGSDCIVDENILQSAHSLKVFLCSVYINFPVRWLQFVTIPHLEMYYQKRLPVETICMAIREWIANERHVWSWKFADVKEDYTTGASKLLRNVDSEFNWKRQENNGRNIFGIDIRHRSNMAYVDCIHVVANKQKSDSLVVVFFANGVGIYNSEYELGHRLLRELNLDH